jgi:hypothetical protein
VGLLRAGRAAGDRGHLRGSEGSQLNFDWTELEDSDQSIVTLLGKAGQDMGMERILGASKPDGISLFRQGLLLWDLLPRMREDRVQALMTRFGELLHQHVLFTGILGVL